MFTFLNLPIELRTMIYRYALVGSSPLRLCLRLPNTGPKPVNVNIALLLVNCQIHHEALDAFYTYNTIVITDFWRDKYRDRITKKQTLNPEEKLWLRKIRRTLYFSLLARASTVILRND